MGLEALEAADIVTLRLREDQLAMQRMGCDYYWLDELDAIYRVPEAYYSRETLFGVPMPDDPLLPILVAFIGSLHQKMPHAAIYAPLGVGSHVDHLITFDAVLQAAPDSVAFYEDVDYALRPGMLEQRLAQLEPGWTASILDIDATLTQKISAIEAYESQIGELFGGAEPMGRAITAYGADLRPEDGTYGERIWRPVGAKPAHL